MARNYIQRPAANGRWQLWFDTQNGLWFAIDPHGSINDAMKEGKDAAESRKLAIDGIRYLNEMADKRAQEATCKKIREFLALPRQATPSACYLNGESEHNPWDQLRDYVLPMKQREHVHSGEEVRMRADRDEWRDGVIVQLI